VSLLRLRRSCVLCGASMRDRKVLTLPATPPANEFVDAPREQEVFPLALQLCGRPDCGHLQLEAVVDPERLFGDYVYVAGTSPVFVEHFAGYARRLVELEGLGPSSLVVDVGSNDGTLLARFAELGVRRVHGVEPASRIAAEANERGIPTTTAFFDRKVALELRHSLGAADVVTANNVFAHIDDLENTALAVRDLLAPDGIFVFEVSYLLDVVQKLLFDTIYHEHLSYHAVRPLRAFFDRIGMTLFDAERVPTHGGSIRCYASRRPRPVSGNVDHLVALEQRSSLFSQQTYAEFGDRIAARGKQLRETITGRREGGARFCGYGAPAKLTTLVHAMALDGGDFEFVVDDSPWKRDLFTPGKHIPVVGPQALAEASGRGYWCVVFAWNFFDPIVARNRDWAGSWLNPIDGACLRTPTPPNDLAAT